MSFRLRDLLLKPGTYTLGLWLGRGGIEEIDSVKQAASFSVEAPHAELKHSEVFPGPYQCRFDHSIQNVERISTLSQNSDTVLGGGQYHLR